MTTDQISELLAPFIGPAALSSSQLTAISAYLELLLKWNSKLNLTAVRDPEEIITRHFGESLFAARQLFPSADSSHSAIDIGSGAGFPGLAIKIAVPSLQVTLIESNHRKATFLREVIRALDLHSATVLAERAEKASVRADLVTFRAIEKFERILPLANSLVKLGGRIAILIGESQVNRAEQLLQSVRFETPISIPNSRSRVLLVGQV